jgi:hypothetical protein
MGAMRIRIGWLGLILVCGQPAGATDWEDRLGIESADERFSIRLGGRLHADIADIDYEDPASTETGEEWRRARLSLSVDGNRGGMAARAPEPERQGVRRLALSLRAGLCCRSGRSDQGRLDRLSGNPTPEDPRRKSTGTPESGRADQLQCHHLHGAGLAQCPGVGLFPRSFGGDLGR